MTTTDRLTVPELATRWRCTEQAVAGAIRRGDLRATKIAGRWLVAPADADAYEQANTNVAPVARRTRRPRPRKGRAA